MKEEIISAMRDIAGDASVLTDPHDVAPHMIDWRKRHSGTAACVVFPRSTQQVSALLAWCNAHRVKVYPQGGNTSVCGGSVPDHDGNSVLVNLAKLNRIREVNAANNSITVEAGCILADIQAAASDVERLFPLSLGAEGSCQIGGNLSTNAGGTNVVRFGNTRDLVLGLEVVLADGRVWNGLRTLRKNNSGYDLKHLFIGAEGTLGIVTAASLKLYPKPSSRATAMLAFANVQDAVSQGLSVQAQFPGELVGLELLSKSEFEISLKHAAQTRNPFEATPEWIVLVELAASSGTSEALTERLTDYLRDAFEEGVIRDAVVAANEQQRADLWKIRHSVTESNVREGMGLTHDIAVPTYRIPDFIGQASKALETHYPAARPVIVGHMGDGNLHYIAMFGHDDWAAVEDKRRTQLELSHVLYDIAAAMGGTFSAEHGIGALHVPEMAKYKDTVEIELMQSIKRLLDPLDTMNPKRVVPGLPH
ncbi:FAD-binding oxidoreductase [Burkholderia multivorans]|uniref:FAD-binding oxidoreductase n=1 Tax=Burkholderia multivorans TaxID=87883 RepID=UPI002019F71B|nr:FAD-binding oxidoreductase [Burkholderia multivorans]MCA8143539.1 FAD-binding oxidoreductase [Burkholderia multivorans]MCO1368549.1 FAD-binding oxidoreductase [Burkholderia multivorans]MCO1380440.1 FAD-binding oxidoreductase [Burkholderia multivorans]UQP21450.1 FAD-binding oxidoreductase [Burkholderia multivorans]UQP92103.1 FAD-binding oxidoreductase [Burkholderia multivorans]